MTTPHETLLLLGRDHPAFGPATVVPTGTGRSAGAISSGKHPGIPSMRHKGDIRNPNEDALAIVEDGPRTLLVVADAHHGLEASHALIEALLEGAQSVPADEAALRAHVASVSPEPANTPSRTTLTLCVVDRSTRRAFGLQWGDSSIMSVADDEAVRRTLPTPVYVNAESLGRTAPQRFSFELDGIRLVIAHTDGIDECNYRSPATSIRPHHVLASADSMDWDPVHTVKDLAGLALRGVDGHPGGEDNLAVGATRVDDPDRTGDATS